MPEILYTRLSPRHNWDLLTTNAENTGNFIRSWNLHFSCQTLTLFLHTPFQGGKAR